MPVLQYRFVDAPLLAEVPDLLTQILELYCDTGWWDTPPASLEPVQRLVAGSHAFLTVLQDQRLVGMGRAISDRCSDAYIQDVVVREALRGQGIGRRLIQTLLDRLHQDGIFWVGLIAERRSHPFYEKLGFQIMPDSQPMLNRSV